MNINVFPLNCLNKRVNMDLHWICSKMESNYFQPINQTFLKQRGAEVNHRPVRFLHTEMSASLQEVLLSLLHHLYLSLPQWAASITSFGFTFSRLTDCKVLPTIPLFLSQRSHKGHEGNDFLSHHSSTLSNQHTRCQCVSADMLNLYAASGPVHVVMTLCWCSGWFCFHEHSWKILILLMKNIFICHHEHIFEYRDALIEKHPVFVSTNADGKNTCCFPTNGWKTSRRLFEVSESLKVNCQYVMVTGWNLSAVCHMLCFYIFM